jgi:MoaA/NifB/PqqE/SkfB family radical SAM enzyme
MIEYPPSELKFCYLTVTERCFFRCKTCYAWKRESRRPEASFGEWKDFLKSLKEVSDNQIEVHLSGGEPLLQGWVPELIQYGSALGFNMTMATNAFLIDREMAGRLSAAGLGTIVISLNSLDSQVHDFLKGANGSFNKSMEAIEYFTQQSSGPRVCICTVICRQSLPGLIGLVDWAGRIDKIDSVSFQAITQPFHTPETKQWHLSQEYSELWPQDKQKTSMVIEELICRKNSGAKIGNNTAQLRRFQRYFADPDGLFKGKCRVGDLSLTLHPDGEISLCRFGSIGNINKDDIRRLWTSEELKCLRKKMEDCVSNCEHRINGSYS